MLVSDAAVQADAVAVLFFVDGNGNGVMDDAEVNLTGVVLRVTDATGSEVGEYTASDAGVLVEGLNPGDYTFAIADAAGHATLNEENRRDGARRRRRRADSLRADGRVNGARLSAKRGTAKRLSPFFDLQFVAQFDKSRYADGASSSSASKSSSAKSSSAKSSSAKSSSAKLPPSSSSSHASSSSAARSSAAA
jgi:hypothetical protein